MEITLLAANSTEAAHESGENRLTWEDRPPSPDLQPRDRDRLAVMEIEFALIRRDGLGVRACFLYPYLRARILTWRRKNQINQDDVIRDYFFSGTRIG